MWEIMSITLMGSFACFAIIDGAIAVYEIFTRRKRDNNDY